MPQDPASVLPVLLQDVELAKVFDLLCHPVSPVKLRAQASCQYSKAKKHRGICESKRALTLVGQGEQMKGRSQETEGKSLTKNSGKIEEKTLIQLLREIGLSDFIVLGTIVFIVFGTEKPWAQTRVI